MLRNGLLTQHQLIEVNGVCVVGLSDRQHNPYAIHIILVSSANQKDDIMESK